MIVHCVDRVRRKFKRSNDWICDECKQVICGDYQSKIYVKLFMKNHVCKPSNNLVNQIVK